MANIKHTKNELKVQRDALRRYERFLPMLQLKKQQLLAEIQSLDVQIAECARRQEQLRAGASAWLPLLNEEPD
ncbi:MAG: V-type ATP synthase subunit D, partial [Lysobacterales bacterium]